MQELVVGTVAVARSGPVAGRVRKGALANLGRPVGLGVAHVEAWTALCEEAAHGLRSVEGVDDLDAVELARLEEYDGKRKEFIRVVLPTSS